MWRITENDEYKGDFARREIAIQAASQMIDTTNGRTSLRIENTDTREAFYLVAASDEGRTERLSFRVTPAEREELARGAEAEGVKLGQYIRKRLFG